MDKKSMGTFLTDLRKERGLTQQEVADSLNVSNKTISKWERDEGYPEITMLSTIAKFYEITTDELLNGERLARGTLTEETTVKKDVSLEKYKTISIVANTVSVFTFISLFMCCLLATFTGFPGFIYGNVGCAIISLLCFILNKTLFNITKKEKKDITNSDINSLCFSNFFFYTNLISCIFLYIGEKLGETVRFDAYIPFAILISIVIIYKYHLRLLKTNNLYSISEQNEKLKKTLSIISKVLIITGFIGAIIFALLESVNSTYLRYDKVDEFVFVLQIAVMAVSIGSIVLIGIMTWVYNKKKVKN
ncbi:MAG: helix-turn-helix transcriptional regulator [Clostridia bacterium]|nr:helix-turn-helix transcriptional regulator [Clostridia bacterium]